MDDFDPAKMEAIVQFMRRLGIVRLGSIELGPEPVAAAQSQPARPTDLAEMTKGMPEGDDALFWSTSGPLPSEYRDASTPPKE